MLSEGSPEEEPSERGAAAADAMPAGWLAGARTKS